MNSGSDLIRELPPQFFVSTWMRSTSQQKKLLAAVPAEHREAVRARLRRRGCAAHTPGKYSVGHRWSPGLVFSIGIPPPGITGVSLRSYLLDRVGTHRRPNVESLDDSTDTGSVPPWTIRDRAVRPSFRRAVLFLAMSKAGRRPTIRRSSPRPRTSDTNSSSFSLESTTLCDSRRSGDSTRSWDSAALKESVNPKPGMRWIGLQLGTGR